MNQHLNQHRKSSGHQTSWELRQVPVSTPPKLKSIHSTIADRRRGRRALMATCTVAFLTGSLTMMFFRNGQSTAPSRIATSRTAPSRIATSRIATSPVDHDAIAIHTPPSNSNAPSIPSSPMAPIVPDDTGSAPETPDATPPITLFANVHSVEPVFEFDDQLEKMVPVGWVQVSDSIPVQLDRFSNEEIQTFQTVLQGGSSHTSL